MITVPAVRLHQFGVFLYQAILGARDVDRLVRFEVLSYDSGAHPPAGAKRKSKKASRVNWELLEKRIAASAEAYQRPIIKKKIAELVDYYTQCSETGNLPAIPGAVLLVADRRLEFTPTSSHRVLGVLEIPAEEGVGALERTHGDEIDLNALAFGGIGELRHRPFQPALLLCAVGDTDFHGRATTEERRHAAGGGFLRFLPGEHEVGAGNAGHNKEKDEDFA